MAISEEKICCGITTTGIFCGNCGKQLRDTEKNKDLGLLRHCKSVMRAYEGKMEVLDRRIKYERCKANGVSDHVLSLRDKAEINIRKWAGWTEWVEENMKEETK